LRKEGSKTRKIIFKKMTALTLPTESYSSKTSHVLKRSQLSCPHNTRWRQGRLFQIYQYFPWDCPSTRGTLASEIGHKISASPTSLPHATLHEVRIQQKELSTSAKHMMDSLLKANTGLRDVMKEKLLSKTGYSVEECHHYQMFSPTSASSCY